MRILVIQNDPTAPAGIVGDRAAARGAALVVVQPHRGGALPPAPDGFDAAIVLGGPQSAADDAAYPAFAPMRDLLRGFHAEARPLLGICLGAQILARCFDQPVRPQDALEFGLPPIEITPDGARDPLLAGLAPRQRVMQWHEDTFHMPEGARHLMRGDGCANQAFRLGRTTYGFQCHFEATRDLFGLWLDSYPASLERHYGPDAPSEIARVRRELAAHADEAERFGAAVADRWLDLVGERGA
jgi:GMP synthase-like glutamine amidotransferase